MNNIKLKTVLIVSMILLVTGCGEKAEVTDTDKTDKEKQVLPLPLTEENCTLRVVRQLPPEKEEIMRTACSEVTFTPSFKESEPREW